MLSLTDLQVQRNALERRLPAGGAQLVDETGGVIRLYDGACHHGKVKIC